jgi:hypothetical protein
MGSGSVRSPGRYRHREPGGRPLGPILNKNRMLEIFEMYKHGACTGFTNWIKSCRANRIYAVFRAATQDRRVPKTKNHGEVGRATHCGLRLKAHYQGSRPS